MSGTWSRRDCLRVGLASGGALCVGWPAAADDSRLPVTGKQPLALWLLIAEDGWVTLRSNASEMGQGSSSALAQLVAEELEQPWGEIRVEMAPIEPGFFGVWNDYVTGGSGTVRGMFDKLRVAGATARQLLIAAAARHWEVAEERLAVRPRAIVDKRTRRSRSFGELAAPAARISLAQPVTPKPRDRWRVIGQPVTRLDLPDKVTGRALFGIDAGPPRALMAAIRQAPAFGADFSGELPADTADVRFVRLPRAIAAVASNYWAARKALDAATLQWSVPAEPVSEDTYRAALERALDSPGEIRWVNPDEHGKRREDNEAAFKVAARVIEARYETPLLAHACLEPMNATAEVSANAATIWAPTQVQASLRREVAKVPSLRESAVTLHTTLLGGGFGRRLETDYGVQAALIARQMNKPVKLLWSREEDIQHDYFRQAAMARYRCALDAEGGLLAVRAHLAALNGCSPGGMPSYTLPRFLVTNEAVNTVLTLGAWRAVECNHNTFFMESFLDEVAHASNRSPLDFRRQLLSAQPRALRILDAAVEASGMRRAANGRHFGIALSTVFGSLCAEVAEISVPEPRVLRIHRITCALDCGTAVNPDSVRAQMEGAVVMGLSAALMERVQLQNGAVAQSNFHDYPILRYGQVPEIHCLLVDSPEEPLGGCGEPPLPPVAPALTNAIFAATGERIRRLPLFAGGWRLA